MASFEPIEESGAARTPSTVQPQLVSAVNGPSNLGFVFDETALPHSLEPALVRVVNTLRSRICAIFSETTKLAEDRLAEQIRTGRINANDELARQQFLETTQLQIFINETGPLEHLTGVSEGTRSGNFRLETFPVGWFRLDLAEKPFSSSPQLDQMLRGFDAYISSGRLRTGVTEERRWGTTAVQFSRVQQPLSIRTEFLVGYMRVTAMQMVVVEQRRDTSFPWRPQPVDVPFVQLSSRITTHRFRYNNPRLQVPS